MVHVKIRTWELTLLLVSVALMLSGCSGALREGSGLSVSDKFQRSNAPVYHEFCDVLIPCQLKMNKERTCIFRTSKFSVGVLSLRGRMDASELISFFQRNMSDDNWNIVNSFKSKRSIMLFKKDGRWCAICISEMKRLVNAEIWVLPNATLHLSEFLKGDQLP